MTTGLDISSSGYSRKFSYPLYVISTVDNDPAAGTMGITGIIDRSKNIQVLGFSAFPSGLESFPDKGVFGGYNLMTRQNGSSGFTENSNLKSGTSYGSTEQQYVFAGVDKGNGGGMAQVPFGAGTEPLFQRRVLSVNGSVARDSLQDVGQGVIGKVVTQEGDVKREFASLDGGDFVGGKFIHPV